MNAHLSIQLPQVSIIFNGYGSGLDETFLRFLALTNSLKWTIIEGIESSYGATLHDCL